MENRKKWFVFLSCFVIFLGRSLFETKAELKEGHHAHREYMQSIQQPKHREYIGQKERIEKSSIVTEEQKEEQIAKIPQIIVEDGITYRQTEIRQIPIEEAVEKEIWFTEWYSCLEEIPKPSAYYIEKESKKTFVLLDTKVEEQSEAGELVLVKDKQVFHAVSDISEIPEKIKKNVDEAEIERTEIEKFQIEKIEKDEIEMTLTSLTQLQSYWKESISLDILFLDYHAPFYMLEGQLVMHNDEKPQLEGMETILLQREGIEPSEVRVKEIRWKGGTFLDAQFGVCREAELIAERKVGDYFAEYQGKVQTKPKVQKRLQLRYGHQPARTEKSKVKLIVCYERQLLTDVDVETKKFDDIAESEERTKKNGIFLLLRQKSRIVGTCLMLGIFLGGGCWIAHKNSKS